jgi:hypothetical protein
MKNTDSTSMTSSHANYSWIHEVLEPDQLASTKPLFGRRKLGATTLALLWILRLYVLLMIFLIGYQVWSAFHAKF